LYKNTGSADVNLTSTVTILAASSTVKTLEGTGYHMTTGTAQVMYVVWPTTSEEVIAAGAEYTYTLKATPTNFNTDAQNDYIRVRMANAQSDTGELAFTTDQRYLGIRQIGGPFSSLVAIYSSGTPNGVVTSTGDIIWSDRSASSHSAATGAGSGFASSTGDWTNGYYITDTPGTYSQLIY
jgi:hypothetical protein